MRAVSFLLSEESLLEVSPSEEAKIPEKELRIFDLHFWKGVWGFGRNSAWSASFRFLMTLFARDRLSRILYWVW
jgi:hypothetical protein